jgi:hypothetical protein
VRGNAGRAVAAVGLAVALAIAQAPVAGAGEGALGAAAAVLLDDSPMYVFEPGTMPTRNAPIAVVTLLGKGLKKGVEVDLTELVRFVPDDQTVTARVLFYGPGSPAVAGGIELPLMPGASGSVEATLIERVSEGTATSPEVWEPADEAFATASGQYTGDGVKLRLTAKGDYLKLLRDRKSVIGLDLSISEVGVSVQPSARVSIGDLLYSQPGLVGYHGTGVADDGTPEPWVTRYAGEFAGFRVASAIEPPSRARVDFGKLAATGTQFRLFHAAQLATGEFDPYQLVLFMPTDTSVRARTGDAFRSEEDGQVTITPGKRAGRFDLKFAQPLAGRYTAMQAVTPTESGAVLLATSFRVKF